MIRTLTVLSVGPSVTLQDNGRPGWLAQGLSQGGAADTLALAEGRALLGQRTGAALEMAGFGGRFQASHACRIALTGAPMDARIDDGAPLAWNASHAMPAGAILQIGGVRTGSYGYLHIGGGFHGPSHSPEVGVEILGSPSAHLMAGIGRTLSAGDRLHLGEDKGGETGRTLPIDPRFDGGEIRIVPSLQTPLFSASELERLQATPFRRDPRANRMGVKMVPETGGGFAAEGQLNILSEIIVPGDIQMTGDGTPFVLLAECQTTGGYPRIGAVIPPDLPRVAQASPGSVLRFRFISREDGVAAMSRDAAHRRALPTAARPLLRDPALMSDLLSYTLISGMIDAQADPFAPSDPTGPAP